MRYDKIKSIVIISEREIKEAFKSEHNYLTFLLRLADKTGNDALKVIVEQMEREGYLMRTDKKEGYIQYEKKYVSDAYSYEKYHSALKTRNRVKCTKYRWMKYSNEEDNRWLK